METIAGVSIKRWVLMALSVTALVLILIDKQRLDVRFHLEMLVETIYATAVVILGCLKNELNGSGMLTVEGFFGVSGLVECIGLLLTSSATTTYVFAIVFYLITSILYLLYLLFMN